MSPSSGKANGSAANEEIMNAAAAIITSVNTQSQFTPEQIKGFVSRLEMPFDPSVVEWRVTNTSKGGKPRGVVIPYANQRAYTDRLNELFTPAGWTRRYTVHTSANFQREKDQKTVAKVFVTCELTIFGIGSHSATGEEWADDENAGTSAEAQAFKRASACFGLGRYLYYFEGTWVDLDERKRPKTIPQLPQWATPTGWNCGLRPNLVTRSDSEAGDSKATASASQSAAVLAEVEALAEPLGRGLYRGLLRDLAKVWNPREIQDVAIQQKVLEHMRAAERGLRRLEAALDRTGPEALIPILRSLGLTSLERVDTLETLKRIVFDVEDAASKTNA
jgi:Rad52/22 family double-strand break repair protein